MRIGWLHIPVRESFETVSKRVGVPDSALHLQKLSAPVKKQHRNRAVTVTECERLTLIGMQVGETYLKRIIGEIVGGRKYVAPELPAHGARRIVNLYDGRRTVSHCAQIVSLRIDSRISSDTERGCRRSYKEDRAEKDLTPSPTKDGACRSGRRLRVTPDFLPFLLRDIRLTPFRL